MLILVFENIGTIGVKHFPTLNIIATELAERHEARCNTVLQPAKSFLYGRNPEEIQEFLWVNPDLGCMPGHLCQRTAVRFTALRCLGS